MSISPQFLDEVRGRVSVSDIVGKRVKLKKNGREFSGLCPFHNEKTPSFTVNDDKAFYHCFGCGAHGDVIRFVTETEGLNFPEAVEKLAGMAGMQVPKATPQERQRAERAKSLHEACEAATRYFQRQLDDAGGCTARDYLDQRGLKRETVDSFRLGWAPEGRRLMKQALIAEGYPEALLIEAGLLIKPEDGGDSFDRFRGRVMFPIADRRGRVIAFGGRALGEAKAKYLNSPETPLFNKGQLLYALDRAREAVRHDADVIVTEGYMDVIALNQAGFHGAVAPLGTALTESQIEELWRLAPEPILCFDGDEAGQRAAARAVDRALPRLQPGMSLRFALLPAGEDPDSLIVAEGAGGFRKVLDAAKPLVDWLWRIETAGRPSDTPERRTAIRKALRDRINEIGERSVQEAYYDEIESRFRDAFRKTKPFVPYAGRPGGAGGNYGAGGGYGGGFRGGNRKWQDQGPSPLLAHLKADGRVEGLHLRGRQALLATVINHPTLFETLAEALAAAPIDAGSDLDQLRACLLERDGQIDREGLNELGLGPVTDRVLSPAVYVLAPFAAPDADPADALTGWHHLYRQLFETKALKAEQAAAIRAFANEPDEKSWAYLKALGDQARPADEEDAGHNG